MQYKEVFNYKDMIKDPTKDKDFLAAFNIDQLKERGRLFEQQEEAAHYSFVIQSPNYKILLGLQTKPEVKYIFKDKEIELEKLVELLEEIKN